MEDYVTQKQIAVATGKHQSTVSRKLDKISGLIKKTFGDVTVYHIETLPKDWKEKIVLFNK